MTPNNEENPLRSIAWRDAEAIRLAKQQAEEALESRSNDLAWSLSFKQAILDATPDGILAIDAAGQVTGMNENFLRLWHLPAELRETKQASRILEALSQQLADPERFLSRMEAINQEPDSFDLLQLTDGRSFERYSRVQLVAGQNVGRVWIFRDVTERKRTEESLLLRDRAIQALHVGLIITDPRQPDNPIIYVSPGFEKLTGYCSAEALGRNCRFLQGKDTDPTAVAQLREAIRAGMPCSVELLNYRKDGTSFWNEISISPIRNEDGQISHFVGVQVDVTERRRLEDKFRQAQKMEAVGRLAGGIAHDFNNLLTVINGYADIVIASLPEHSPSRQMLEEVRKAGERATSLTQQLLAFSRKSILAPRLLDVNDLIHNLERMLRPLIGVDIHLHLALAPDLGRVLADPNQLEQALVNLCVNSRDAMPHGGHLILETQNVELDESYTRTHPEVTPGAYVLIAVSDTGVGMTREVQTQLFEPFFTTKGVGKGTGLGLSMVFGFIKQSGGHVTVYSELGRGTTVKLYLPRAEANPTRGHSGHRLGNLLGGVETILLVEDEEPVRVLGRDVLQRCGYTVLEAKQGREAVQLAEQHTGPLHLLVTDMVLRGGMNGRQVAEAVLARHPETKVLYTSGYTDDVVVRNGLLEAGAAFLQKPYTPSLLTQKVREVLDRGVRKK